MTGPKNFEFAPRVDMQALYKLQANAHKRYKAALAEWDKHPDPIAFGAITQTFRDQTADCSEVEQLVGSRLSVPPNSYVARALGQRYEVLGDAYDRTCGQIEIFRHYNNVANPRLVLGPEASEDWLEQARLRCIPQIASLQLAQVAMSDTPEETAYSYALEMTINDCGVPDRITPQEVANYLTQPRPGSWLGQAYQSYMENWDPEEYGVGLPLDELADERW